MNQCSYKSQTEKFYDHKLKEIKKYRGIHHIKFLMEDKVFGDEHGLQTSFRRSVNAPFGNS